MSRDCANRDQREDRGIVAEQYCIDNCLKIQAKGESIPESHRHESVYSITEGKWPCS